MLSIIVFALLFLASFGYAGKRYMAIRRNIFLGKAETTTGDTSQRWKNVALVAFGQKKMFKRWIPAVLHLFIYVAFSINST